MNSGHAMRLAVIGLDGMSWRVLLRYVKYGVLKAVEKLLVHSVKGLNICIPPYTPPSWISIFTGVKPTSHRILSFVKPSVFKNSISFRFVTSCDVKYPRLNEILAMNGLKGLVYNLYPSYPPSCMLLKNQVIIFDDLSPKEFIVPSKYSRYLQYFEKPKILYKIGYKIGEESKWLSLYEKYIERIVEGLLLLDSQLDLDFLITIFKAPDTIMHHLPYIAMGKYNDKVANIFAIIDEFIDEISKKYDVIVIVSDHGFEVYPFRVNVFGLLKMATTISTVERVKLSLLNTLLGSKLIGLLTYALLYCCPKLFVKLKNVAKSMVKSKEKSKAITATVRSLLNNIMVDPIDPNDSWILYSKDFCKLFQIYGVLKTYINHVLDYVEVVETLNWKALMVRPKEGEALVIDESLPKTLYFNFAWSSHSPIGIFIMYSKHYIPLNNHKLVIVENTDITPTILAHLNLPIGKHFEGKILKDLVCSSHIRIIDYMVRWKILKKLYSTGL